jgi:DNA-binding transcriptional MerR regulator
MTTKKLYYSMGEVAEMFDVTPALIRHWESQFDCIKPHRNKKGNRLFTQDDVDKLKHIYHLVKERGMTLKGANQVLKRGKRDDVAQQMELLERLYRIRASLVEVREELKAGDGEKLLDSDVVPSAEPAVAEEQPKKREKVVEKIEETPAEPVEEQPKKRVVRRKKKSDDDNKELFPFYEQSLF